MTGGSSNHTGKVWQQEVSEEPPQDHTSDQEETKDKESLSEVKQRADQLEFISVSSVEYLHMALKAM